MEHDVIYLEPIENQNPAREWCQDDIWGNGVKYVRLDLVIKKIQEYKDKQAIPQVKEQEG